MKANNTGVITKATTEQNYTIIPNSILQSTELTFDAKGVLSYLLSLPSDWSIVKTILHKQIGITEYRLDKAFKELINNKYIHTIKTSTKTGWVYDYKVFSVPTELNDNRVTDKIFTSEIIPEQQPVEEIPTEINNTIEILNEEMKNFEEEQEEEEPEEIENNNTEKPIEKFNKFLNSQKIIDIAMYAVNENFSLNEIQSILSDRYSINTKMKKDVVLNNLFGILTSKQMNTNYKFNNR